MRYWSNSAVLCHHLSCMGGNLHIGYSFSPRRQRAWPYSLTIAIRIFWASTHHFASTLCFAILFVVCSDESRFHRMLRCIEWMLHPPACTALEIWSWLSSTGACAHQTIDMASIMCWSFTLWARLWRYDELHRKILGYTSLSPLTTPIIWSQVACHLWEERKLRQLTYLSVTNVDIPRRLNRKHHASACYETWCTR